MDTGNSPGKGYSENYQAGPLSFEFFFKDKKLITNSGFFQDHNHQLYGISKSTAAQSTLILDNSSACNFKKNNIGQSVVNKGFKLLINRSLMKKLLEYSMFA